MCGQSKHAAGGQERAAGAATWGRPYGAAAPGAANERGFDGETQRLDGSAWVGSQACSGGKWWLLWLIWPVALAVKGLAALPLAGALFGLWQALAAPALLVACGVLIGAGLMLIRRGTRDR